MAENPGVKYLKALTGAQIRGFTRDQILKHQGLAMLLTPDQLAVCQIPLAFLQERLEHLNQQYDRNKIQETANERQTTIDEQNLIIASQASTINEPNLTIANYASQKNCWTCFFLGKSRAEMLIKLLFFTIVFSLLTSGLAPVKTEEQITSKKKTLWALGGIELVIVVLLLCWKIARHKYLLHPHN